MPARPVDLRRVCAHCGRSIGHKRASAVFCDAVCKQRAYWRRRAGLAEWEWSVNDALRGRVPLAGETRSESQRRAERDELYAIRLALRLRPGGGTVVIDDREVTVIDPILGAP